MDKWDFCLLVPEITRPERLRDWQEAVHLAIKPLQSRNIVPEAYEKQILDRILEFGPYCIVRPGLALIHGPVIPGIRSCAVHIMIPKMPAVLDGSEQTIQVFIALCASSAKAYMELIRALSPMLRGKDLVSQLITCSDAEVLSHFQALTESGKG